MILIGTQSCDGMDKLSNDFLDEGSLVYAAKVDSVAIHSGNGRIVFEVFVYTQRVESFDVIWADGAESKQIHVGNKPGVYEVELELEESVYVFNMVSTDSYGNKSLPIEIEAQSYGDNFQKGLNRMDVKTAEYDAKMNKLTLVWGSVTKYAYLNEITYTDADGKKVVRRISTKETTTEIDDWSMKDMSIRTLALPDSLSVDTFYTAPKDVNKIKLTKKNNWSIVASSGDAGGDANAVKNSIDDNYTNRWHSPVGSNYPQYVVIDFASTVEVNQFGVWSSVYEVEGGKPSDNRFPTKLRIEVSVDEEHEKPEDKVWTDLGEFTTYNENPGERLFDTELTKARYYRFTGLGSAEGIQYMVIGEFDVYMGLSK